MKMRSVKSSNIREVGWEAGELHVTFASGSSYVYSGVDRTTYENLLESESPGSFFHRHIRDQYSVRREG